MLADFDIRGGLPGIQIPSVVIAGTHDQLTFLHTNEEIVELIPGCQLEVLPGFGHQLMFEAPDQVTDQIVQATKPVSAA
jgi:pimeloyl-ACP methyl ester carboxylesterase